MTSLQIRPATKEDYKEIQRLNYLLFVKEHDEYAPTLNVQYPFEEGHGSEYFLKAIDDESYLTLVAENNGKLVGYLIGYHKGKQDYRVNINLSVLDNMFVEEEFRSQGVGHQLVDKLIAWSKERGANTLKTGVFEGNNRGANFYLRENFKAYEHILEKSI